MFRAVLSTLAFAGFLAAAHPVLADPVPDHTQARACVPNQAVPAASAQPVRAEHVDTAPVGFGWS